jgi:hypothetical protein
LLTLAVLRSYPGQLMRSAVVVIGAFTLYTGFANNLEQTRLRASLGVDQQELQQLRFEGIYVLAGLLLFLAALIKPVLVTNLVTAGLYAAVEWVYRLPVIGWLVGVGGFFFLIGIIWRGLGVTSLVLSRLFGGKPAGPSQTVEVIPPVQGNPGDPIDIEYEVRKE